MHKRDLNKFGCGLGLTIVKTLVHALGGEINVASKLNYGSEFTIKLPHVQTSHSNSSEVEIEFSEMNEDIYG